MISLPRYAVQHHARYRWKKISEGRQRQQAPEQKRETQLPDSNGREEPLNLPMFEPRYLGCRKER